MSAQYVFAERDNEKRSETLGKYIIETQSTVRDAAGYYGISKSTVHKDVTERLSRENPRMHILVKEVLEKNKSERHIRGGEATRKMYERKVLESKSIDSDDEKQEI